MGDEPYRGEQNRAQLDERELRRIISASAGQDRARLELLAASLNDARRRLEYAVEANQGAEGAYLQALGYYDPDPASYEYAQGQEENLAIVEQYFIAAPKRLAAAKSRCERELRELEREIRRQRYRRNNPNS